MNWSSIIERYIAEARTVSGGKGDNTAQSTEANQSNFTKTLTSAFQNNNNAQQGQLNFLNGKLQSAIANPTGYSPESLAAMRTQATEAAATQNQQVNQAVNSKFATETGPTSLPNGVQEQVQAQTANAAEKGENDAQLGITEQDAALKNENQWKAIQGEEGVAGLENPEGMASTEENSANSVSDLSKAVTSANGPGIGSILGGVVGAGLSGWASGGFKH